jgi:hypothetical protein
MRWYASMNCSSQLLTEGSNHSSSAWAMRPLRHSEVTLTNRALLPTCTSAQKLSRTTSLQGSAPVTHPPPLEFWDKLLPQATITLDLLHKSWINPHMSASGHLNGHYAFNRVPIAPPGTGSTGHENTDQRASWYPYGTDGYYLTPAVNHFRCNQVYITKTRGVLVVDTVELLPAKNAMPKTSSKDLTGIAVLELSRALTFALPSSNPSTISLPSLRNPWNQWQPIIPPCVSCLVTAQEHPTAHVPLLGTPQ